MAYLAIGILYLIAVILGTWSASLFWRAWHAWRLERRARRKEQEPVRVLTPGQRRFGILVALVALPLAGFAFSYAEMVRANADAHQELGVVIARAGMAMCLFLSAGAVYVAFRFDPAQGRRRCGRCWYDMSATAGRLCPECGHEARDDKALYRTRRAPRLVIVAGLLLLVAYGAWVTPRVVKNGVVAGLPTTALIVLLPWAPDSWIENGTACLYARSAQEELWDWQTAMLRWRARGVVQSTPDLKKVRRCAAFVWDDWRSDGFNAAERVTMHPRALLEYIRESCDSNQPAPNPNRMAMGFDFRLAALIPETLEPSVAEEAVGLLRAALEGQSEGARFGAASWTPLLGPRSAALAAPLEARITDPTSSSTVRAMCVTALRSALEDENAWRIVTDAVRSNDINVRVAAMRVIALSEVREEEVLGLARQLMSDPDDRIASAAASAYFRRLPSMCDAIDDVLELVRQRPAMGVGVVDLLAADCLDSRVVEIMAIMLESKVLDVHYAATTAAERAGALGRPLLPALRRLSDPTLNPQGYWMARRAIELIDAALKPAAPGGNQ